MEQYDTLHTMKKIITILAALFCLPFLSSADDDYAIQFSQIPAEAQAFVRTHFDEAQVAYCMRDRRSYEVKFADGAEIEFNAEGKWKEVDCKYKAVPASVLELIPAAIQTYVKTNFPKALVSKVDVKRRGYELKLNNGLELEFNNAGKFLRMDD